MSRFRNLAFTLAETLVVIAIVAIVSAILIPVFNQAKASGKNAASASNLRQIGTAVLLYAEGSDDRFPLSTNYQGAVDQLSGATVVTECALTKTTVLLDAALGPYIKSKGIFSNPYGVPFAPGEYGVRHIGYEPNCRLIYRDYRLSALPAAGDTTLANEDDFINPRTVDGLPGMNCLFDDVHVRFLSRSGCLEKWEPEPSRR